MSAYRRQLVRSIARSSWRWAIGVLCGACLSTGSAVAQTTTCPVNLAWDTHEAWETISFFDIEFGTMPMEPTETLRVPGVLVVDSTRSPNKNATVNLPRPTTYRVYYFQARAVDGTGTRSVPSNSVSKYLESTCGTTTTDRIPPVLSGVTVVVVVRG